MDDQLQPLVGHNVSVTTDGTSHFLLTSTGRLGYNPDNRNYNSRDDTHGLWFSSWMVEKVILVGDRRTIFLKISPPV